MRFDAAGLAQARDEAEVVTAIAAAAAAGLFTALGEGVGSAAELAERAGLDPRATGVVLEFLAQSGVLERDGAGYRPTPEARVALCDPEASGYAAGGLPHWLGALWGFAGLGQVLTTGAPVGGSGGKRDEAGLARFMAAMAAAPRERVERIVDLCLARRPDASTVLDVGGGPGHMTRAFADRGLRATLLDTPATVEFVGREYGLAEAPGIALAGADFLTDPLPDGPFDVVLLSNVLHIYGSADNRRVLEKVGAVTAPGGVAAIVEFVGGRSPKAPRFALMMLLRTEAGSAWSEDDYRGWLEAAGFGDLRVDDVDEDRQLVSGVRAAP